MKLKDKKELRTKTREELKKIIDETNKELVDIRLEHVQHKLKNTRSIFLKRKYIAYLSTLVQEKETI